MQNVLLTCWTADEDVDNYLTLSTGEMASRMDVCVYYKTGLHVCM